jgi:hypothetical protein
LARADLSPSTGATVIDRYFSLRMCAAAALAVCAPFASAVQYGVIPAEGLIFSPFNTKQELTAWKLVGRVGTASAVQIHPRWILTARHNGSPASFQAKPWSTPVSISRCYASFDAPTYVLTGRTDFTLCQLVTAVDTVPSFPPLVAAPATLQLPAADFSQLLSTTDRASLRPALGKYGALLSYGFGANHEGLVITDFAGMQWGHAPAMGSNAMPVPQNVSGDSGGGAYWISPSSGNAALVGVLSGGTLVPNGVTYLTQDALQWMSTKMAQIDGSILSTLTATQHHALAQDNPAPELATPPAIQSSSGTSNAVTVNLPAPPSGLTSPITSYAMSLGRAGVIERQWMLTAGQTLPTSITGLIAASYILCARPTNAIAPALAAYPLSPNGPVETPNCTAFNTAPPGTVSGLSGSSIPLTASTARLTFNWTLNAPAAAKTRIQQVVTYSSGPARTTTFEVATASYTAVVPRGVQVCVTTLPLSAIGVTNTSQASCLTVN